MLRALRSSSILLGLSGALLVAPVGSVASAQVIDQSNSGPWVTYGCCALTLYANSWLGQTFRPTANTVSGAGFEVWEAFTGGSGVSGTFTVQLWDNTPSVSGATMLASGTTPYYINGRSYLDVFWSAVSVTPGAQYFLAMQARWSRTRWGLFTLILRCNALF